jgi:hypothetical protein
MSTSRQSRLQLAATVLHQEHRRAVSTTACAPCDPCSESADQVTIVAILKTHYRHAQESRFCMLCYARAARPGACQHQMNPYLQQWRAGGRAHRQSATRLARYRASLQREQSPMHVSSMRSPSHSHRMPTRRGCRRVHARRHLSLTWCAVIVIDSALALARITVDRLTVVFGAVLVRWEAERLDCAVVRRDLHRRVAA